jgi:hypothetical protein
MEVFRIMSRLSCALGLSLAMVLLSGSSFAADDLQSGPQVGKGCVPFNPLHCNGPDVGQKLCLV